MVDMWVNVHAVALKLDVISTLCTAALKLYERWTYTAATTVTHPSQILSNCAYMVITVHHHVRADKSFQQKETLRPVTDETNSIGSRQQYQNPVLLSNCTMHCISTGTKPCVTVYEVSAPDQGLQSSHHSHPAGLETSPSLRYGILHGDSLVCTAVTSNSRITRCNWIRRAPSRSIAYEDCRIKQCNVQHRVSFSRGTTTQASDSSCAVA